MRPPSYYASLSNYNYASPSASYNSNGNLYASSSSSTAPTSSQLNRSSSSHQLRTSFSSPSSTSYVTRSHLPFVSQSMLVAHCFTGVSSSTKPNYGHPQRAHQPTYSSGSTAYSTSYSRPKSLKRYPTATSGYQSSSGITSSYTPSSARNYHLSPSSAATTTSSYTKRASPTASSYFPKPVRLRERPLLTQISRQLNQTSTTRPLTGSYTSTRTTTDPTVHSRQHNDRAAHAEQRKPEASPAGVQQGGREEEDWSTDVARNISRNKYLIKFREFEKRPSSAAAPIQLTNRVEPLEVEPEVAQEQPVPTPETDTAERVPVETPTAREQIQPDQQEPRVEAVAAEAPAPPMKVPVSRARRPSAEQPLESGLPKKVAAKAEPNRAELATVAGSESQVDSEPNVDISSEKQIEEQPKKPRERREVKLRIKTSSSAASGGVSTESKAKAKFDPQDGSSEMVKEKTSMPDTKSSTSDSSPQVTKPKVKRLVKTSSKAALKAAAEAAGNSAAPKEEATQENSPPVAAKKLATKPATTAKKATTEKPKQKDEDSAQTRKVLAVKQEQPKEEPAAKREEPTSREVESLIAKENGNAANDSPEVCGQQNKRIRFRNYHLEDFNFLSVLGHGGWGFVVLAELKEHDACFAVKCIKKITIVEDDDFDSIMIERKVLALGNVHPFICKLFCTFETEGYLFFVMEYCAGGDLMFHVQKEGKFTEARCRFYAAEIICAIRFLHNRHIIYRDLKLDNILLDSRGHVRLVDFGMCQCRTYREEMLPSNFCGTPEYISPEIIKGVPYNHSVDWWSFGVLLYEMAVGKMPFRGNDENELLWNVCYEQIHYPMFLTKELTSLLQSLLEREPTKRMGMATCKAGDIYDQTWFRGVDWRAIEEMRVEPPFLPEVTSKRDVQNFDADFTESRAELSPVDEGTLQKIDQTQFQGFPYTNPDIFIFDTL